MDHVLLRYASQPVYLLDMESTWTFGPTIPNKNNSAVESATTAVKSMTTAVKSMTTAVKSATTYEVQTHQATK